MKFLLYKNLGGNCSMKRGFGILEVLIAGLVISMMLSALVAVGNMAMNSSRRMHEKSQAYYLAQDGLEQFRRLRDSTWFDSARSWDNRSSNYIDYLTLIMQDAGASSMSGYIMKNGDFAWNSAETGWMSPTNHNLIEGETDFTLDGVTFRRRAEVYRIDNLVPGSGIARTRNALKVKMVVYWENKTKSVEVSELLTDWRPNY